MDDDVELAIEIQREVNAMARNFTGTMSMADARLIEQLIMRMVKRDRKRRGQEKA